MSVSSFCLYDPSRTLPRLPREGWIDLTYRCNFHCRHCWVSLPAHSQPREEELSLAEYCRIAEEARRLGCTHWSLSGGEPLLRPDFDEIFACLTGKAISYTLNTNGSLITPAIAKLLTRRGSKLIALYGADAQVQDHITRTPGSFEALLRGCHYLREAGAGFTIQIIPMRDNYHQLDQMYALAASLSPSWRIGASWLYLTAARHPARNQEIIRQRLDAAAVNIIDPVRPHTGLTAKEDADDPSSVACAKGGSRMLWPCIMESQQFHIDACGGMSFCSTIKDPALRFSVREYSLAQIWDELLPALAHKITEPDEYLQTCAVCTLRPYCSWCPAYAWLENGRLSAPVPYLCEMARERKKYEEEWFINNRRYFQIAGITVQVDSDIPFAEPGFEECLKDFRVDEPGDDLIRIHHHYALPDLSRFADAELVYHKIPWAIYRFGDYWIYQAIGRKKKAPDIKAVAFFNDSHTRVDIYHRDDYLIRNCKFGSLTALPSDHIMLARVLADRQGCVMHSSGMIMNGRGLLFVGPSGAGKSTVVKLLREHARVLCDDRIIVRLQGEQFHIHGTWSHGEIPEVANAQAPLSAIFLLKKARKNRIIPVTDRREILHAFLLRVVRPLASVEWLDKTLTILTALARQVPVYQLHFTREGNLAQVLEEVVGPLSGDPAATPAEKRASPRAKTTPTADALAASEKPSAAPVTGGPSMQKRRTPPAAKGSSTYDSRRTRTAANPPSTLALPDAES